MRMNLIGPIVGAAAVFVCSFQLSGCATAEPPSMSMNGMSVSFDEPDGSVLWFELTVVNIDSVDLPLAEARYSVQIDGRTVFRGVRSAEATAPAKGVASIRLPASVPSGQGVEPGARVTIKGRLTYLTPSRLSEVLFDADIFRPEKGFTATATIPDLGG